MGRRSDNIVSTNAQAPAGLDPTIHKMLAHPLRHAIYMHMGERPWGLTELATKLSVKRKRLTDQVEVLKKAGLVEAVEKRPLPTGGYVWLYRSGRTLFGATDWEQMPPHERAIQTTGTVRQLHDETARAVQAQAYEDPDHVLIRLPIWVDREGMQEINAIFDGAYEEVVQVGLRSAKRRGATGESPIHLITGLTSFPSAADDVSDS
jgi:DNA-binding HxlR family transcriptional regulator